MDKLVIDASVAVKWFVVKPYSNEARRVLDTYQSGEASFYAPDILPAEFANTIWKKRKLMPKRFSATFEGWR